MTKAGIILNIITISSATVLPRECWKTSKPDDAYSNGFAHQDQSCQRHYLLNPSSHFQDKYIIGHCESCPHYNTEKNCLLEQNLKYSTNQRDKEVTIKNYAKKCNSDCKCHFNFPLTFNAYLYRNTSDLDYNVIKLPIHSTDNKEGTWNLYPACVYDHAYCPNIQYQHAHSNCNNAEEDPKTDIAVGYNFDQKEETPRNNIEKYDQYEYPNSQGNEVRDNDRCLEEGSNIASDSESCLDEIPLTIYPSHIQHIPFKRRN